MTDSPRFLLAGGGTAGHVNPLISVASKLREAGASVEALGTKEGLESDLVPRAGIELHTIERLPLPRSLGADAFRFLPRLRATVAATERIFDQIHPDALVGFGGYVSAPAYLVARKRGIPVVIHEQNARPGMANRLGARWAKVVATTFPSTKLSAKKGRSIHVGLPLRPQIEQLAGLEAGERRAARESAAAAFDLDADQPILVVTGGSLGAQHINEVMVGAMPTILPAIQVIHLTGKGKAEPVAQAVVEHGGEARWKVRDYALDMAQVLAAADLVVCRAGAGTVAELTALGLPAIYVPLPIGNGEQRLNAADHVAAGGAHLIKDADFTTERLTGELLALTRTPDVLERMRRVTAALGRADAAETVAKLAIEVAGGTGEGGR